MSRPRVPEAVQIGGFVLLMVLLLPVMLLCLPFVAAAEAWQERTRVCPLCGQRGTLRRLFLQREPLGDASGPPMLVRRRIAGQAGLRCTACGLVMRAADG